MKTPTLKKTRRYIRKDDQVVQLLIDLLIDPTQEWHFDEYTATHSSGMSLWIANIPILNIDTYPVSNSFTLWDKYRLWKAMKTTRKHWALRILSHNNNRK